MKKYFAIILLMVAFIFGKQAAVEAGNSIYVVSGTTNGYDRKEKIHRCKVECLSPRKK